MLIKKNVYAPDKTVLTYIPYFGDDDRKLRQCPKLFFTFFF